MAPVNPANQVWSQYASSWTVVKPARDVGTGNTLAGLNYYYYELKRNQNTVRLKYTIDIYGSQPSSGYPLFIGLHGGGQSTSSDSNDWEWQNMARNLYGTNVRDDIKNGVYIAARGITDNWCLHFESETYFLLQRLIRNLLFQRPEEAIATSKPTTAQNFVDPNRIYILGFSAGGDGVYRLATVLADKFAAANMCAGHPGNVKLSNLANVPMCLQVGEGDNFYGRNVLTVKAAKELDSRQTKDPGFYVHDIFMHPTYGKPAEQAHNLWIPDMLKNGPSPVYQNWRDYGTVSVNSLTTEQKNTCSVAWVNQFVRNPVPRLVVWDISLRTPEPEPMFSDEWAFYSFNYWLAVPRFDPGIQNPAPNTESAIRASYDKNGQWVWVGQIPPNLVNLVVFLKEDMVDLNKPVDVFYGPNKTLIKKVQVLPDGVIQQDTLRARGDPQLVFSAAITVNFKTMTAENGWDPTNSKVKSLL